MQQVTAGSAAARVHRPTRPRPPLVLVDGSNLLWRAAYGFPAGITTRRGRDVTGLFAFFALLRKALHELNEPAECIVVFDSETGWTGRRQEDPTYKQHRESTDFSPITALADIQRGLTELGISWQESGDWRPMTSLPLMRSAHGRATCSSCQLTRTSTAARPAVDRPTEHRSISRTQDHHRPGSSRTIRHRTGAMV